MIRPYDKALALIQAAAKSHPHLLVAIDGRCAAGKTTLAEALGATLNCPVIHMDHFFLRPAQRTPERLSEVGGNLDRERFIREVLTPLRAGEPFAYAPFDCKTRTLAPPVSVPAAPITLIEGSYACHPDLRDAYHLRFFLSVEPEEQIRRLRAREGEVRLAVFQTRWIPMEEAYFSHCRVEDCCIRLDGDEVLP